MAELSQLAGVQKNLSNLMPNRESLGKLGRMSPLMMLGAAGAIAEPTPLGEILFAMVAANQAKNALKTVQFPGQGKIDAPAEILGRMAIPPTGMFQPGQTFGQIPGMVRNAVSGLKEQLLPQQQRLDVPGMEQGEFNQPVIQQSEQPNIEQEAKKYKSAEEFVAKSLKRVKVNYFVVNKALHLQTVTTPENLQKRGLATQKIIDIINKEKPLFLTTTVKSPKGKALFSSLERKGIITKTSWDFDEYGKRAIRNLPVGDYRINYDKIESIKTKKQLTDIWNKAQGSGIEQEAKKYKSAEEWVESQDLLLHGSDVDITKFDIGKVKKWNKFGHFFTKGEDVAKTFGDKITEATVDIKNPKVISQKEWWDIRGEHAKDDVWFSNWKNKLKSQGFDGVKVLASKEKLGRFDVENPEIIVAFEDSQVKTKSQLTDIWNKANK